MVKRRGCSGHIEVDLTSRREDPGYFKGREFRRYSFMLSGTTYAWAHSWGNLGKVPVMDVLAQCMAGILRTGTMIYSESTGTYRRYKPATRAQQKKGWLVVDEKTGRPLKGFYT